MRCLLLLLALTLLLNASGPPARPVSADGDRIESPAAGAVVSGRVEVRGTAGAAGSDFRSYRLEFGTGREPSSWQLIGTERDVAVFGGVLGIWETGGLAPGEYSLRLLVFSEGGRDAESWVQVTVAAAPPEAATPTASATAGRTPPPRPTPTATRERPPTPTPEPPPEPVPTPPGPTPTPDSRPPTPAQPFHCPMLYYHEVPGQAALAAQVAAFLQAGYRPVTMGRLVEALEGRAEPPPGCLVLTFDDGLASQMSGALPVLLRFRVAATFFVMPDFRDGVHRYMGADDFRALREAGMEIGSHTLNHASLPRLLRQNFGAFQSELVDSKRILEQMIGGPVELLAYPNGAWDPPTADEVRRAGYRAAASTVPGGWQRPEELYWLRRFRADPWEAPGTVLARLRG